MIILIFPNLRLSDAGRCVLATVDELHRCGLTPAMTCRDANYLGINGILTGEAGDLLSRCDLIIAIGGDGTIFHQAAVAMRCNKPILGINSGRLGFLSQLEANDLSPLAKLATGDYVIENRMVLRMTARAGRSPVSRLTTLSSPALILGAPSILTCGAATT